VVRQPCWYSTAYSSHLHDGVSNELRSLGCTSARRLEGMLRQTAPVFLLGMLKLLSAIRYCDISIQIQPWKHGVEKRKKGIQPITVENPPDICFPVVLWVKSPVPLLGQSSK
jgi:hypothetical protein